MITSIVRRIAAAATVLRWTPWFALFGVVVTAANVLIGNHINVAFWVASWALPGLALDLSRLLNGGGPAWRRKEIFTARGLVAVAICLGVAVGLEMVLDRLGGYHETLANSYVNTDWSQFGDVVSFTVAVLIARQLLQWTRPKAPVRTVGAN